MVKTLQLQSVVISDFRAIKRAKVRLGNSAVGPMCTVMCTAVQRALLGARSHRENFKQKTEGTKTSRTSARLFRKKDRQSMSLVDPFPIAECYCTPVQEHNRKKHTGDDRDEHAAEHSCRRYVLKEPRADNEASGATEVHGPSSKALGSGTRTVAGVCDCVRARTEASHG